MGAQHNQASASAVSGPLITLEKAKLKLKNILVKLLKLSNDQAEGASKNVSRLVQALIDQKIQPDEFTQRIQKELNLSENRSLSPFLQKTLPYFRYSLATGEIKIDGLVPPSLNSAPALPPVVPASPMSPLGSETVANAPMIRAIQPNQFQSPQTQITVQAPVATQHTIGAPPELPRTPNIQNRIVIPKEKVPYRNLETPNQLKTVNKGIESPVSMCSFVQKSIISKENKFSSSLNSSTVISGDDDINDVATMGGVNLAEESQRLLGPTKLVGTQIRSVKNEGRCDVQDSSSSFRIHKVWNHCKPGIFAPEKRETEENLPSINQPSTSKRQLFTSSSESLPLQSFNFQEKSLPTISQTSKKHLEDLKSGVVCDVNEEKSEKSSACPDIIKEGFDAKNNPTEVEVEMSPDKNVGANNDNAAVAEFAEENEERGLVEPEPVGNGVVRDGIESESSGEEAVSDEDPIELLQRRELELKTPANSDEEDDSLNSIKKQKRPLLKRFTKKKQKPAAQRSLNPTFEGMDGPNQREIPKERKEENMTKEVPSVVQSSSFEAEQVKKSAFDEPSKFNRDPGTWVQCTNSYCEKWRFLKKFRDPSLIPEVWTCSMNSDVTYNDCSIPEESWSKEEEVSSVYTAYVPGSLVWAKVRGYPWWPGMVVQDPEIDKFFQLDG
ncbi:hypothetical protein QYM36_007029, partial [Artemia franciscana]